MFRTHPLSIMEWLYIIGGTAPVAIIAELIFHAKKLI